MRDVQQISIAQGLTSLTGQERKRLDEVSRGRIPHLDAGPSRLSGRVFLVLAAWELRHGGTAARSRRLHGATERDSAVTGEQYRTYRMPGNGASQACGSEEACEDDAGRVPSPLGDPDSRIEKLRKPGAGPTRIRIGVDGHDEAFRLRKPAAASRRS
jgi:hypothetical protein